MTFAAWFAAVANNPLYLVRAAISSLARMRPRPLWFGKSTDRLALIARTEVWLQPRHMVHVVVFGIPKASLLPAYPQGVAALRAAILYRGLSNR